MINWEGGENRNRYVQRNWKRVKKIWKIVVLVIYTKKLKERKLKSKIVTYLFSACLPLTRIDDVPLLEGERRMTNRILAIPILHYELKGASYTTIEMDIHHHKPSTALARARQLGGYRFHLDPQTQKRETKNKTRIEKRRKLRFDSINNGRKDYLHRYHLQYKLALIPPWNIFSSVT